jgi:uncharacterized membrane protein YphA (DoxX/SURF4 family)
MATNNQPAAPSKAGWWIGCILSALPVPLFLFSAVMKFVKTPEVVAGFAHLGWPDKLALALGITELTCTLLYAIPQTAVLGAVLLTGYLGGAIATHARIGEPFLMQAGIGVVLWLGLYLREPRLRALLPLRQV